MPDTKEEILRDTKVEEIYGDYKDGLTTRRMMNKALRDKAHLNLKDEITKNGYTGALIETAIGHGQDMYNHMIDDITVKPINRESLIGAANPIPSVSMMWHAVQGVSAMIGTVGEVTGAQAELIALKHGASSGYARMIGMITEIGTNFLPMKIGARTVQKGMQKVFGAVEATVGSEKEQAAMQIVGKVVEESLKAEGLVIEKVAATAEKAAEVIVKAANPLNLGKRAKLTNILPDEIKSGLDILKAQIPKFGITPTKEEFETLRKLARGALKDGTQDSETSFAKYMAAMFSPQTGEKLNISKQMVGLLTEWAPEAMAQGNLRGAMKILAEDISALSVRQLSGGANLNLVNLARQNHGYFAGIREVYTNMLLPFSVATAFIGNSVAAGTAILERSMVSPTQGWYLTKGMTFAVGDGIRAFGNAFRGVPNAQTGRLSWPAMGPFSNWLDTNLPGRLGRIVRGPTEGVLGADNFFNELFTRGSYYASAVRDGMNRNLHGAALGQHVRQLVQAPQGWMKLEAQAFSEEHTFQNQLGPLAHEIQSLLYTNIPSTNIRLGQLYFPMMKSAINVIKFGWDRMPGLQLISYRLWSDLIAGGARGDAAVARLIMGNMMGMYFHELAKEDLITGAGPVDPRLRETWLLDHKPHSMRLPSGEWMSNKFLEPMSEVMDVIADFTMISDQLDDMTLLQGAHAMVYALIANFGSNSWWMQASQMINLVQGDLSYDASMKIVMAPVVTVAHGGTVGTRVREFIDPAVRDTRTWVDQRWANTPGYSNTIPKMRDVFGDPLALQRPLGGRWFGFLGQNWPKFTDLTNAPEFKKEAARLGVKIDKFPNSIGVGPVESPADIKEHPPGEVQPMSRLTNDEKDQWQEIYNKLVYHPEYGVQKQFMENPLINNPDPNKAMPVAGKRSMMQGLITDMRDAAKVMLITENKELGKKIFTNEAQAEIKKLPMEMRPGAQQALDYGLSIYDKLSSEELKNIMKWGDLSPDEEAPAEPLQLNVAPTR